MIGTTSTQIQKNVTTFSLQEQDYTGRNIDSVLTPVNTRTYGGVEKKL